MSHVGAAFAGGMRVPFVGRVSMDLITIDVGDVPADLVQPGAWVEILGEHQSADDLATLAANVASGRVKGSTDPQKGPVEGACTAVNVAAGPATAR